METPGERMKHYIEKMVGIGIPEFAEIVGVQSKSIYNIINNEIGSIVGKSTSDKIKKQYPLFPLQWVKKGGEVPDIDTAVRKIPTVINHEELALKDQKINILEEEIVFLNKRVDALIRENERYEKEIGRLELSLDKKQD